MWPKRVVVVVGRRSDGVGDSNSAAVAIRVIAPFYGSVCNVTDPRNRKPKTPVLGTRLVWAQDGEDRSWPPDWLSRDGE